MADSFEIKCINKTDRLNPHERIKRIGGANADGSAWALDLEQAMEGMEGMEEGRWTFYVRKAGAIVRVVIAKNADGNKYLKTESDGITPDNLLSLPECP